MEEENEDGDNPGLPLPDQSYFAGRKIILFTRADVATMLECDDACRKVQYWPLIPYDQFRIMASKIKFEPSREEMLVSHTFESPKSRDLPYQDDHNIIIDTINRNFPSTQEIFALSGGHLVMAGGAVSAAIILTTSRNVPKDADWFFFDHEETITIEEAEATIRKIVEWWLGRNRNPDDNFRVYRNSHVTTLFNGTENDLYGETHQLIHRIYPNKSAVIGGFDLAPCSVLYDGKNIYATELGAFSLVSGYFCPDVSRQSFSFDHRICKYSRKGFVPIFLTKSEKEIREEFPIEKDNTYRMIRIGKYVRFIFFEDRCTMSGSKHQSMQPSTSDYDNGQEYNPHVISNANTQMAAMGKIEMMVWGGGEISSVFGDNIVMPRLDIIDSDNYWGEVFPNLRPIGKKEALFRWFRNDFLEANCLEDEYQEFIVTHLPNLRRKIAEQFKIAESNKGRVNWLGVNDNPSRQRFTSSIHPVEETISWYNPEIAKPVYIGVPFDVVCVLFIGWKRKDCILNRLPRDIFHLFMKEMRHVLAISPFRKWMETN